MELLLITTTLTGNIMNFKIIGSDNMTKIEIYNNLENDYDCEYYDSDLLDLFDQYHEKEQGIYFVTGTIGRWDGNYPGACSPHTFDGIYDAVKWTLGQFDYAVITTERGRLYIKGIDHDGNSFLEVRKLNKKGEKKMNELYTETTDLKEYMHKGAGYIL